MNKYTGFYRPVFTTYMTQHAKMSVPFANWFVDSYVIQPNGHDIDMMEFIAGINQ
jgi:hypothetical protein